MIYECDQCSKALPPGVTACPNCGEAFEDIVPADAEVPRRGFSAAPSKPSPLHPKPKPHSSAYDWLDAPAEHPAPSGPNMLKVFGGIFLISVLIVFGVVVLFNISTTSDAASTASSPVAAETLQQDYDAVQVGASRTEAVALVGREPDLTYTGTLGPVLQWKDGNVNVFRVMLQGDQIVGATYVPAAGGLDASEIKGATL